MVNENNTERLARLEEKIQFIQEQNVTALKTQSELTVTLKDIKIKLESIDKDIIRYKGMIGGITLVLSGIGLVLLFFKGLVLKQFGIEGTD